MMRRSSGVQTPKLGVFPTFAGRQTRHPHQITPNYAEFEEEPSPPPPPTQQSLKRKRTPQHHRIIRPIRSIPPNAFQVQTQPSTLKEPSPQPQMTSPAVLRSHPDVRRQQPRCAQHRGRHAVADFGIQAALQCRMESLVEGDLVKLLNQKGIDIKDTIRNKPGGMRYTDEHGIKQEKPCEIDIIAKNGEEVVAVEVKTTLRVEDVDKFLDILPNFTRYLPQYSGKKVYGAVAYLQAKESSEIYAEKRGLFVIRATGNSASIINDEGFKAKVFG